MFHCLNFCVRTFCFDFIVRVASESTSPGMHIARFLRQICVCVCIALQIWALSRSFRLCCHNLALRYSALGGRNAHCTERQSYLILPIQRLARYVLLLRQIRQFTPASHPDSTSSSLFSLCLSALPVASLLRCDTIPTNLFFFANKGKHLIGIASTRAPSTTFILNFVDSCIHSLMYIEP